MELYFPLATLTPAILLVALLVIRLDGLTIRGPAGWLLFALGSMAVAEFMIVRQAGSGVEPGTGWTTALRFAAAAAMLCPQVSVLGAKRPQHAAWHAIVFSLWLILILPAAEGYFIRRSAALEMHDARGWFLWILILVGWANYGTTRHGLAALLYAAAQIILLSPHLPLIRTDPASEVRFAAFLMVLASVVLIVFRTAIGRARRKARSQDEPNVPVEIACSELWRDFRDTYGAAWTLRLSERLNATAKLCNWPIEFGWSGVRYTSGAGLQESATGLSGRQKEKLQRIVRTALRRFVSPIWIETRIN